MTIAGQRRESRIRRHRRVRKSISGTAARPRLAVFRSNKHLVMQVIDDNTILFRDGRTVYLQKPRNACFGIANHSRTLVTRQFGTNDLCDGDINRLVDLGVGMQGGACVFGPFVPYTKPKG